MPDVSAQFSVTGSGPAFAGTEKKLAPVDSQYPVDELYVSGWLVPLTFAVMLADEVERDPMSTFARTPIVHVAAEKEKYGSAHEPLKSVTSRASGAFGCAPLPAPVQPRTYRMPRVGQLLAASRGLVAS